MTIWLLITLNAFKHGKVNLPFHQPNKAFLTLISRPLAITFSMLPLFLWPFYIWLPKNDLPVFIFLIKKIWMVVVIVIKMYKCLNLVPWSFCVTQPWNWRHNSKLWFLLSFRLSFIGSCIKFLWLNWISNHFIRKQSKLSSCSGFNTLHI